jgi:hypothetical protein
MSQVLEESPLKHQIARGARSSDHRLRFHAAGPLTLHPSQWTPFGAVGAPKRPPSGARNLKVFDILDFGLHGNQKWDRLGESHARTSS